MSETTEREALLAVHALEELLAHPGWALVTAQWRESEQAYDQALHRERTDDMVRMQICQTSCKVLREVLDTPRRLLAACREAME